MNKSGEKKTENLGGIRLTKSEKLALQKAYREKNYFSLSAYMRHRLLDEQELSEKDIAVIKVADQEIATGNYLPELGQMGDKVNQIAKRMNTFKDGVMLHEELLTLVESVKLLLKIKKTLTGESIK
jgi:hypothetical protein